MYLWTVLQINIHNNAFIYDQMINVPHHISYFVIITDSPKAFATLNSFTFPFLIVEHTHHRRHAGEL